MLLTKRDRNKIFEVIVSYELDPVEFDLQDTGKKVTITHSSGSTFTVSLRLINLAVAEFSAGGGKYHLRANVPDGMNETSSVPSMDMVIDKIRDWLDTIRLTVGVPDYWAEIQGGRDLVADIQRTDSGNMSFTEDEQRQIAAQIQEVKKQVTEQFELTDEQIAHIDERLDEAAEAAERMGRKDWLLLFGGTVFNLIVTDTVTPSVAGHIFTTVVHGLIHLFTGAGGPPQILA